MTSDIISIVVPTFKEAKNIPSLLQEIDTALAGAGLFYEIIIVDDNSGDGIVEVVDELKDRYTVRTEWVR